MKSLQHLFARLRIANDCRGQALIMTALLFAVLLGFLALLFDGGRLYFEKRRMQIAADAAAIGGAHELFRGNPETLIDSGGKDDAKLNGYDDSDPATSVVINHPPANGPYTGDAAYVEAILSRPVSSAFARVFRVDAVDVRARAVAGIELFDSSPCILALNESAVGGLTVSGTSEVFAPDCSVMVNSNDERAIIANGGGCLTASKIGFVQNGSYAMNGGNCVSPEPKGRSVPYSDPYAGLPEPNPDDYPLRSATRLNISSDTALLAGVYRGGIKITGGNVTFAPGTYIVDGLEVSGNTTITSLTSTNPGGTTFYNTAAPSGLKNIQIAGTVTANLVAPTTGTYQNILFFNSRSAPTGFPPYDASIAGTSFSIFDGVFYFPTVNLTYAGTSDNNSWMEIVADTITITGESRVSNSFDGSARNPDKYHVALVE